MSGNEEGKSTKSDNPTQAAPEQSNVQVYHHDWAAMHAYYGPRVALPQYYNSNVATGHAPPPYMWASPSPMMGPYGSPYPPFCPPGGVYAHPGVQMGSQPQGLVSQATSGVVTTPLNMDAPANSPGNTEHGFMKKLKEFDGLAMSISNNNNKVGNAEHSSSDQSSDNNGSSNGSDGNTTGGEQSRKRKRRERSPTTGEKPDGTMVTSVMPTSMDFQNSAGMDGIPHQWKNEKEVKREKRKQSNRESARRSRLRKQAETEQLSVKVDALVAENMNLRSKLSQLNDESEKLRLENEALLGQLKSVQTQATGKTENLISRVDNNNNSVSGNNSMQHQLLNASPITDPVAAS
ncbi:G-box-binding factor 2 [Cardamine amara subsp. amara]|uniref:G-box-binding factor 2 n=1 Tax=Cardamine amara subsp. amara TaxID=228776 RepID=A0ABD0ZUK2_CARAN